MAFPSGLLSDTAHQVRYCGQSRLPSVRRSQAVWPCRKTVPRAFRSQTRSSGLRRSHPPGRLPDSDATLCPVGIAAQRMLPPETRGQRTFFMRVVQRHLGREEVFQPQSEPLDEVRQQEVFRCACVVECHPISPLQSSGRKCPRMPRIGRRMRPEQPMPATKAGRLSNRCASTGHSGSAA